MFAVEGGEDVVLSPSLHSPPSRRAFATPESPPLSALEAPLPLHGSSRQVQPKKSDSGGVGSEETWLNISILKIRYPLFFNIKKYDINPSNDSSSWPSPPKPHRLVLTHPVSIECIHIFRYLYSLGTKTKENNTLITPSYEGILLCYN